MDGYLVGFPSTYRDVKPIARYGDILSKAESGDADAQYELAQIYNFCWRIPDEAQQKELLARGMTPGSMKYFGKSRELCEGFEVAFEEWGDPAQAVQYWNSLALSNAQPMALAEKSLKDFRDWQRLKVRYEQAGEALQPLRQPPSDEQMYLALSRGTKRPEILSYAIRLGYRYFRVFNAEAYMASQGYDPSAGQLKRGPLREAWSIWGCYSLPSCSLESHLSDMRSNYHRHEMDENVRTARELYEAIEAHEWEKLGLAD